MRGGQLLVSVAPTVGRRRGDSRSRHERHLRRATQRPGGATVVGTEHPTEQMRGNGAAIAGTDKSYVIYYDLDTRFAEQVSR
jgi:hypothetical protein